VKEASSTHTAATRSYEKEVDEAMQKVAKGREEGKRKETLKQSSSRSLVMSSSVQDCDLKL